MLFIGLSKDYWVYGIFGELGWLGRSLFGLMCLASVIFFYLTSRWLQTIIWPENRIMQYKLGFKHIDIFITPVFDDHSTF